MSSFRRGIPFRDVKVSSGPAGNPVLEFHGTAREAAVGMGVKKSHVSVSHDGAYVTATVILEG